MNAEVKPAPVTTMDAGLYRKNVMKTLSVKPAKLGLVVAGRNTERTCVQHAAHGFVSEALEFFESVGPYMLGAQMSKLNLTGADGVKIELGDCGYYLAVLQKFLKLKPVSAKKKVKLEGTVSEAVVEFMAQASKIADLSKKVFYGPKTKIVEKQSKNPKTGELGEVRQVPVLDKEAEKAAWVELRAKFTEPVNRAAELHAALCLAFLGETTGPVNLSNIQKLQLRFGDAGFEWEKAEKKDPEAEAQAANAPAEAQAA